MPGKLSCPYCDVILDEAALLTNICSACHAVLGAIDQTMQTIRLNTRCSPLSESEIKVEPIRRGNNTQTLSGDLDDGPLWEEGEDLLVPLPADSIAPIVNANRRTFARPADVGLKGNPDFTLCRKIGEGGMGEIHEATQQALGRTVAVKVLNLSRASSASGAEKFKAEAAVTGNLEHPNIVPIYDLGLDDEGEPFYAMKKVNGKPWAKALEGMSLQENIEILLKVCDAVAFAHSKGVIHRDLKPENVMLGEFGEVLLMDWGLAAGIWAESKAPAVTYADAIAGTPAYMAPEMALGNEDMIGVLSDIYLLGAILYEIITGKPPHVGKNVRECLSNAAENNIEEPWISSELLKTALKAMASMPTDRYESVREFQTTIREHFRSVEEATRARRYLAKAKKSGEYRDYFRAVFGFAEALEIWDGNESAATERETALRELVALALNNGDRTLAASMLTELREDSPELRERLRALS